MYNGRDELERLIQEHGENYTSLSRLLNRNAAYIQQFIKRGSPQRLAEEDRRILARHFGVSEALLGGHHNRPCGFDRTISAEVLTAYPPDSCGPACKRDPVSGVIGV